MNIVLQVIGLFCAALFAAICFALIEMFFTMVLLKMIEQELEKPTKHEGK